jgi:hypothetical protein
VANLQEQVGTEVVLKTLRAGLQPRRSKSLATLCSPAIAACSLRDTLMLTGNLTDHDASRRQAAPRCGSPSPMPSRDRRTKRSSPAARVPFASRRGYTASQHRSTAIVEEAIARLSPFVRYHLNSTSTADTGSGCPRSPLGRMRSDDDDGDHNLTQPPRLVPVTTGLPPGPTASLPFASTGFRRWRDVVASSGLAGLAPAVRALESGSRVCWDARATAEAGLPGR